MHRQRVRCCVWNCTLFTPITLVTLFHTTRRWNCSKSGMQNGPKSTSSSWERKSPRSTALSRKSWAKRFSTDTRTGTVRSGRARRRQPTKHRRSPSYRTRQSLHDHLLINRINLKEHLSHWQSHACIVYLCNTLADHPKQIHYKVTFIYYSTSICSSDPIAFRVGALVFIPCQCHSHWFRMRTLIASVFITNERKKYELSTIRITEMTFFIIFNMHHRPEKQNSKEKQKIRITLFE